MACVWFDLRLNRAGFFRLREKTECGHPSHLRAVTDDLSLLCFQYILSCGHWGRADSCTLLCQDLIRKEADEAVASRCESVK